jgi:signal transduction histidine kinase/integral membrane sensor domain MASE1
MPTAQAMATATGRPPLHPALSWLLKAAAVAAAYAICGRLSLLLAIPPGYATAVWPPSGIALAGILLGGARLWPGVLLGSFLVNVSTSWDASTPAALALSLAIALAIGGGAALQAVVGAWLIRRFVGYRNIFTQEVDVVRILLFGAPLSCLINSVIGVGTLWLAGLIPAPSLLFNWWTWWVGDSIGVLIFTPLICAWALRPRQQWLGRQISLTLPLAAMFAAVVALFFYVSSREQTRLQAEFDRTTQRIAASLQARLDNDLTILDSINGLFAVSDAITARQFHDFVAPRLQGRSDIKALEWQPRIEDSERDGFEQAMRAAGDPAFRIWEKDAQGRAVPAARRPQYVPVTYIEPIEGNDVALGYDDESEPTRAAALRSAMASGRTSATARIRLVQETGEQWATILFSPVFRSAADHGGQAGSLRGFAVAVFRIGDLAQSSMQEAAATGLELRLLDNSLPTNQTVLYQSGNSGQLKPRQIAQSRSVPVRMAERQWTLEFILPADYLVSHRSWQAWGLLAVGLLITGLLGILILVLIGRESKVEELVQQRTAALRAAQQDLERSNAELEQFAYVASHDLQAPLRSIVGFGQLLQSDYKGRFDADADSYIGFMVKSAGQMQSLIRDLLSYSRIGRGSALGGSADCGQVLAGVLAQLQPLIQERGALISHDPLPVVACAPLELGQIFQNLIGNALKFQPAGNRPLIHVGAEREGGYWRLSVRDNGIGIDARYRERIFQMFQRLHGADKFEGTGIGLAICRKIVLLHGGRLWVESEPGRGSTFYFTFQEAV